MCGCTHLSRNGYGHFTASCNIAFVGVGSENKTYIYIYIYGSSVVIDPCMLFCCYVIKGGVLNHTRSGAVIPGASSTEMTHAYPKLRQCVVSCTHTQHARIRRGGIRQHRRICCMHGSFPYRGNPCKHTQIRCCFGSYTYVGHTLEMMPPRNRSRSQPGRGRDYMFIYVKPKNCMRLPIRHVIWPPTSQVC